MFGRRHHVRGVAPVAAHVKLDLGCGGNVESEYVYAFICFTKARSRSGCEPFLRRCLIYCISQSKNEPNASVSSGSLR